MTRTTWFVEDPANDCAEHLILDFDTEVVHVQVSQPGWPGLIETPIPNDVWKEIAKDLIEIHPKLSSKLASLENRPFNNLSYRLNADWQSVANLLFMLGASGMSEHRAAIISAWRRQPIARRKVSWLRNGGDPSMVAAQLLATVKNPSPVCQMAVRSWVGRVIADNTAQEDAVSPEGISWIYANTPLGESCAPHLELVRDRIFVFAAPVFTNCDIWLGDEYLRGTRLAQEAIDALETLAHVSKQTGHEKLSIARDFAAFRSAIGIAY